MQIRSASRSMEACNSQDDAAKDERSCYQKFSDDFTKQQKLKIGCGACNLLGCAGVIGAVVAVVAIVVITPAVSQSILDKTEISLPNMTFGLCNNKNLLAINHAEINIGGPPLLGLSVELQPYKQEIYTTLCGKKGERSGGWNCGENATRSKLGTYESPKMQLYHGKNAKTFSVAMHMEDLETSTAGLIVPTFLEQQKAHIILNAPDLAIKFGFLTITGLHMNDIYATCSGVEMLEEQEVPNWVCNADDLDAEPTRNQYYVMKCDGGKHPLTTSSQGAKQWVANKIADFMMA